MKEKMLDEFIAYAKEQFGLNVSAYTSDTPDNFEKIFGGSFAAKDQSVFQEPFEYLQDLGIDIGVDTDPVFDLTFSVMLDAAA